MAKKSLADEVHTALLARAPQEVRSIKRTKSEGRSKRLRIKALHYEAGRVHFRVTEPGEAHDIHVISRNAKETVDAVYQEVVMNRHIDFETVGAP